MSLDACHITWLSRKFVNIYGTLKKEVRLRSTIFRGGGDELPDDQWTRCWNQTIQCKLVRGMGKFYCPEPLWRSQIKDIRQARLGGTFGAWCFPVQSFPMREPVNFYKKWVYEIGRAEQIESSFFGVRKVMHLFRSSQHQRFAFCSNINSKCSEKLRPEVPFQQGFVGFRIRNWCFDSGLSQQNEEDVFKVGHELIVQ